MSAAKVYDFKQSERAVQRIGPWVFVFFALFSIMWPLIDPDPDFDGKRLGLALSFLPFSLIFGVAAVLSFLTRKRVRTGAVEVSSEGLWRLTESKRVSLVPWQDMASVKERSLLKRLDILDVHGRTIIEIEYQLERFAELKEAILSQIRKRAL